MVLQIKYWGLLGRASGLFRMLEESGVEYEYIQDRTLMNCALFGAESTNLAPPIITDGEVSVSQAPACFQYLGNKLGFNEGIDVPEVAMQYILDLNDLFSDMQQANSKGRDNKDVVALQAYMTGDRYKHHLEAINRSIKGPYYFGDKPTYVDFATTSYFDMLEGPALIPLMEKSGDTLAKHAPKLKVVLEKIRALESAKKLAHIPTVPSGAVMPEERIATWK